MAKPAVKTPPKAKTPAKAGIVHCKNKSGDLVSIRIDQIQAVVPCAASGNGWESMFDVHMKDTGKIITVDKNPLL